VITTLPPAKQSNDREGSPGWVVFVSEIDDDAPSSND
jgi:hypothetical protein